MTIGDRPRIGERSQNGAAHIAGQHLAARENDDAEQHKGNDREQ